MVTVDVLPASLRVAPSAIERLCREFGVRELWAFGSVLRPDFDSKSDIDLLVDFEPNVRIGLLALLRLQDQLAALFGRRIDLVPKAGLKPRVRQEVLDSRRLLYAA